MKTFFNHMLCLILGGQPYQQRQTSVMKRNRAAKFETFKLIVRLVAIGVFLLVAYGLSMGVPEG